MEESRNGNGDCAQQSSSSSPQHEYHGETMTPVGSSSSDPRDSTVQEKGDDGHDNNDIETDQDANNNNGQINTTKLKKKTKARYSKAKKRELKLKRQQEEDSNTSSNQSNKKSRKSAKKRKEKRPEATQIALKCAQQSLFTRSVTIMSTSEETETKNESQNSNEIDDSLCRNNSSPSIRIVTSCNLDQHQHENNDNNDRNDEHDSKDRSIATTLPQIHDHNTMFRVASTVVRVQPLLVLDLNGVLCHRVRTHKQPPGSIPYLREPVGFVAQTNVIERPGGGTEQFLRYLDQHFCLAIWTSAKRKTMNALLDLLVPADIRERFLFTWGQNYCTAVKSRSTSKKNEKEDDDDDDQNDDDRDDDRDDDILFEKRLANVWQAFPLWSANNTLLMDDSPDKCRRAVANAIHPIPLHGQKQNYCCLDKDSSGVTTSNTVNNSDWEDDEYVPPNLSDEENCQNQEMFFQRLVSFFNDNPVSMDMKKNEQHTTTTSNMSNVTLRSFLATHAEPTFVWRDEYRVQ